MVRVDQATYDALQRYAESTERNVSQVIRLAIRDLLKPTKPILDAKQVAAVNSLKKRGGQSSVQRLLAANAEPDSANYEELKR